MDSQGPCGGNDLVFEELGEIMHPVLKCPCGYYPDYFREIQPPMPVQIEELISETQTV